MLKSLRIKLFKDLRANRGQFLTVWFVVMMGTAFYGASYPAGVSLVKSVNKTYDELDFMHYQVQFGEGVSTDAVDVARGLPNVEAAEGRLVVDTGVQAEEGSRYLVTLRLISVPDDREPLVNMSDIVDGHNIEADDEILLLKSFADHHGIEAGDTIQVTIGAQVHSLRVAGLAFNPEYIVAGRSPSSPFPTPSTFGAAWIRYTPLAELTGQQGQISDVVVHLADDLDDAAIESVQASLVQAYASYTDVSILAREHTASGGVVGALIHGNMPIAGFYSGIFLLGSTVMTSILLGRVVQGERRRIGTMRAMGITRRELVEHYLSFGLLIGVTGGLVGTLVGYFNSFWVLSTFVQLIVGGTLPGLTNAPQWSFLLLGFAITVVGSTLAGVYPAWVESATSPGVALRPATPRTPSKVSQLGLPFLPLAVRQSIRNLLRVPGRSLSTALGVTLGATMIFSCFALWDTINDGIAAYFGSNNFDLRVDMNGFQSADDLAAQVSAVNGVESAQPVLIGPVMTANAAGKTFDTLALALDESDPFLRLTTVVGTQAFSSGDGVWIGHNVARVLDLHVGDPLTIQAFGQTQTATVRGIVSMLVGGPVYVPRSLMMQWTPGGTFPANAALVRVQPGHEAAVRDALVDLPGMLAVEVVSEFESDINSYLLFFRVGTIIFGGFGLMLTLAVLFNTVNAGLRERQGELSVLRALGSTPREIAIVVVLELVLMVIVGAVIGIPIGREVGYALNSNYNSVVFSSINTMKFISYVLGLIGMLVIVLLATWPGLRAVQKIDLGAVSKSQSF